MYKRLVLAGLLAVVGVQAVNAEGYRNSDGSYGTRSEIACTIAMEHSLL